MRAPAGPSLALVAALALVLGSPPAAARPKGKGKAKPTVIDISSFRDRLVALTDDDGVYYVAMPEPFSERLLFVGDGKDLYEQPLMGGGSSPGEWGMLIYAPRSTEFGQASLDFREGRYLVDCGEASRGGERPELRPLSPTERERLLSTATFRPRFWNRKPRYLARDEAGTYYYVDQLTKGAGGEGYRVFVGKRGKMKELPMTSVVVDSAGDIYSTKRGELRIVLNTDQTAAWIKGRKRTPLTVLPVDPNLGVIYRDLGVYGYTGTVCDDQ